MGIKKLRKKLANYIGDDKIDLSDASIVKESLQTECKMEQLMKKNSQKTA